MAMESIDTILRSDKSAAVRILAVITARGGSKRLPRKNIRILGGKPLIAWTIEAALAVREGLHAVVVSTDDEEVAAVARQWGADVPFLRPPELASDQAKSLPAVQHAVKFVEARDACLMDWVLLLQPTSPLRTGEDIASSIALALKSDCDSVISVYQLSHHHPIFAKKIDDGGYLVPFSIEEPEGLRRQEVGPPAYMRNGAIFLTKRGVLMDQNSIWGSRIMPYLMPEERSVDIDSELDLLLAETIIARRA